MAVPATRHARAGSGDAAAGTAPRDGAHYPVVIVGGGLVGLTLALDLARRGLRPVVLEKGAGIADGSRSICQAQRSLEIWDRLGVGEWIRDRGVTWRVGRVYHGSRELYRFDLLPEPGYKMPAFVNLQQFHVEDRLAAALDECGVDVRWQHEATALRTCADRVSLAVAAPEGAYAVSCDWLVACDGARSTVRRALALTFEGRVFRDRFLIVDARFHAPGLPADRRFWFQPPFHDGQTMLLHRQPDDVWRLDFQLGWDADPLLEREPGRVRARVARALAALGVDATDIELVWVSVYAFQCRTLDRYVHGRVLFAGDAAHQVSPFGARGGNGGVQDADNLGWKLARIVQGASPSALLASYDAERVTAARENLRHSSRATDFLTPKTPASRRVRDAVLELAATRPWARPLVNSGRLSAPAHLRDSPLNTPDESAFATAIGPGSPSCDARIRIGDRAGWWLEQLRGSFAVLTTAAATPTHVDADGERVPVLALGRDLEDPTGDLARRLDLAAGTTYLFRPDQHVAGRWRTFDPGRIVAAWRTASGRELRSGSDA